jgi:hypothetical protein
MRSRIVLAALGLASALGVFGDVASAQTPPPDVCSAYVHILGAGPTRLMDYGTGLWFPDGEIVQTFPWGGDPATQVVQVILPTSSQLSAKPVVLTGNGGQGWIAYVGDPRPLSCGDSYITVPLSQLG